MTIREWFAEYFAILLEMIFPQKKHSAAARQQGAAVISRNIQPTQYKEHLTFLPYHDTAVKHFLYALKYEQHKESAAVAADILWDYIGDEIQEQESIQKMQYVLCTIPATQEREEQDGYHHLHSILDALYSTAFTPESSLPIDKRHLLAWSRPVRRQSKLPNRSERLANVSGAMVATEQLCPNTTCFVIDDITTTGATLTEAHRALIAKGAHTVITLALAH